MPTSAWACVGSRLYHMPTRTWAWHPAQVIPLVSQNGANLNQARIQIIDLDGGVAAQQALLDCYQAESIALRDWGPRIRLACRHGMFQRFEEAYRKAWDGLAIRPTQCADKDAPTVTLYGSGDFHHVTLALLRRLTAPFNLLVLDKHPDWMRGIPLLHCGTWLYHAVRLPLARRVFHVGGDLDFDNFFRWLAPWPLLRSGRITVIPALRRFQRGGWSHIRTEPLRMEKTAAVSPERIADLVQPFRADLERWPLYVSVDKDVLMESEAVVNWDSGHLLLSEVRGLIRAFLSAAKGRLAGADIIGDWSPVHMHGCLRRLFHITEHPSLSVDPDAARRQNEHANLGLVETILSTSA